jgi:hypothetical protein
MISKAAGVLVPDAVVVSAGELTEVIGTDLQTVNNWIRRGIISRTLIGGRQVKNRLFAKQEVYKAALKNELVKLGIPPSSASDAVDTLWKDWDKKELTQKQNLYAVVLPSGGKLTVCLCTQKKSGGPLYEYKSGDTRGAKSMVEMDLPQQAFAVIPISDVLGHVNSRLSKLLLGTTKARFSRG